LQQASAATTAVRLIALLPRRTNANTRLAVQESGAVSATHPRALLSPILIAIYLILSLGIQFFVARSDPALRTNTVRVPPAASVPSQTPPVTSDK
jgi:hypothetical protein